MPSVPYHNHDMRYYRRAEVNARLQGDQLLATLLTVDGAGSGLDADKLDGSHASAFAAAVHTHDDRYYTETEIGTLLGGYALLAGRSGGQTLYGGTGSGDNLVLDSTGHASKGYVTINPGGGYVAIGTPTPVDNLHVLGNVAWQGVTLENALSNNTSGLVRFVKNRAGSTPSANDYVGGFEARIGAVTSSVAVAGMNITAPATGAGSERGFIGFSVRDGATWRAFQLCLTYPGYVGIGTTTPQAPLHVNGAIMVDGDSAGYAGAVTITDQTQGVSSGIGTVKVNGPTARNSTGWLKILVGTTAVYVPYFQTITG